MDVLEHIRQCGVVPLVVLEEACDAVPTARALLAGGVNVIEIALRTPAGLRAIENVAYGCPEICVGAGTVVSLAQCKEAVQAGAKFIVSPGFCGEVVSWCVENGITTTPGCVTPTEITAALACGLHVLKFFPADVYGGLAAMKALCGPFAQVKFVPTGGIDQTNLADYITSPHVFAAGGSWLASKEDISAHKFERIEARARVAMQTVAQARLAT